MHWILPIVMPTIKQTPWNRPKCLLSVTSSVGNTSFNESGLTIDSAVEFGFWIGVELLWRRWTESISAREKTSSTFKICVDRRRLQDLFSLLPFADYSNTQTKRKSEWRYK